MVVPVEVILRVNLLKVETVVVLDPEVRSGLFFLLVIHAPLFYFELLGGGGRVVVVSRWALSVRRRR